jgi:hypothetical protein
MILIILKAIFLFIAILFTIANIIRVIFKNDIPVTNTVLQTIGITGFIVLQWLI